MRWRRSVLVAVLICLVSLPGDPAAATPRRPGQPRVAFVTCCWRLRVANADGSGLRSVAAPDRPDGFLGDPTWSPDGAELAYVVSDELGSEIRRVGADGSGERRVIRVAAGMAGTAWSPAGDRIAFSVVTPSVGFMIFTPSTSKMFLVSPDGRGLSPLTPLSGVETCPAWSPDGRTVAFLANYNLASDVSSGIYLARPGSQAPVVPQEVTPRGLTARGCPVWSPDGNRLVFSASYGTGGNGSDDLWVMDADGSNARRLSAPTYYPASWSPDGRWIAFADTEQTVEDSDAGLWMVRPGSGQLRRLTAPGRHTPTYPAWSPDGGLIAFARTNRAGHTPLLVVSPRGGLPKAIYPGTRLAGVTGPIVWAPSVRYGL